MVWVCLRLVNEFIHLIRMGFFILMCEQVSAVTIINIAVLVGHDP